MSGISPIAMPIKRVSNLNIRRMSGALWITLAGAALMILGLFLEYRELTGDKEVSSDKLDQYKDL